MRFWRLSSLAIVAVTSGVVIAQTQDGRSVFSDYRSDKPGKVHKIARVAFDAVRGQPPLDPQVIEIPVHESGRSRVERVVSQSAIRKPNPQLP